jgi:hypothetical protein
MCSRRFSYVSNARGLGRSAAAGTSLVTRVPRRSLAWSSAKLLGGHQRGDQRGNRWQSEAIIRGRSERPSEAIRGHQRSSGLGGSHTRGSLMIYEAGNQRSSELTRGHQTSSEVIRGHQRSSEVIRRHQRSSEVIRGHQRSSDVIRGHQTSSEVIRRHQRSSEVIRGGAVTRGCPSGRRRESRREGRTRPP